MIKVGENFSTTRKSAAGEMLEVVSGLGVSLLTRDWFTLFPHCLTTEDMVSIGAMPNASTACAKTIQKASAATASSGKTTKRFIAALIPLSSSAPFTGSGHGIGGLR